MTAPNTTSAARVSVHGGHSKEFGDANDSTLEETVRAYVDKDFKWVGTGFSTDWPLPRGHVT